jgi:preprotein translocase SecE subunit
MNSNQQLVALGYFIGGILVAMVFSNALAGGIAWINAAGWLNIYDRPLLGPDFTVTSLIAIALSAALVAWVYTRPTAQIASNEIVSELRKVTWPEMRPWFSAKAEVWAGTYVVIVAVVVVSAILFLLDMLWSHLTEWLY